MAVTHTPILSIEDISIRFGGLQAVNSCSFTVGKKEIFALIGPNGAGKTTLPKALATLVKPSSGDVSVAGFNLKPGTLRTEYF